MATILEGAIWTVTEEVAEHMVETGLLSRCTAEHIDVQEFDKPIYHISCTAPRWFGFHSIPQAIESAEKAVEEQKAVDAHQGGIFAHKCEIPGCSHVVQYDDEPWCFTHSPDSGSSVSGYSARQKARKQASLLYPGYGYRGHNAPIIPRRK